MKQEERLRQAFGGGKTSSPVTRCNGKRKRKKNWRNRRRRYGGSGGDDEEREEKIIELLLWGNMRQMIGYIEQKEKYKQRKWN
jgi:hypothetical protein